MIDYQRMEKYSVCTLVVGLFLLSFFSWSYALGFLLGGLSALLAFKWLQRLEYLPLDNIIVVKKALTRNKLIRYLIYALAIGACFIRPSSFNYVACFIGILIVRFWFVYVGGREND